VLNNRLKFKIIEKPKTKTINRLKIKKVSIKHENFAIKIIYPESNGVKLSYNNN